MTDFNPPPAPTEPNGATPTPPEPTPTPAGGPLDPVACPVPGCDAIVQGASGLGSHLRMHRKAGHPGTPPIKRASVRKRERQTEKGTTGKKVGRPVGSKTKPKVVKPGDVADAVLAGLYPNGIPQDRLRSVLAWVEATDRMAAEALADQPET